MEPLTAEHVKAKARALGADLVGIASGAVLEQHPPDPRDPQVPSAISSEDNASVIVVARHLLHGTMRMPRANNRQKQYAAELTLNELEETCLDLVYFIEAHGFPALTLPPMHTEPAEFERYAAGGGHGPISLVHAAVEAGLGTLGLNLMLLTPEYGPRVLLAGVMTSAPLQPDSRRTEALCRGSACGRCLLACPGDAIQHWKLDKAACAPYASPYGYHYLLDHVEQIIQTDDPARRAELTRGRETFEIWQSVLRGVGAYTGCTRCLEVCPVGEDYARHLEATQHHIPEASSVKQERLDQLRQAAAKKGPGPHYPHSARWIGDLPDPSSD